MGQVKVRGWWCAGVIAAAGVVVICGWAAGALARVDPALVAAPVAEAFCASRLSPNHWGAAFGTLAAKAAVRDVGRVLDLPYLFCDGIAKLIPFQPGKLVTLKSAREMEPLLAERERDEEDVRELLALAESLEGLTRNVGMHAGGVLIAPGKLTDFCPLYVAENDGARISQFDKDDVEAVGLVKFDFLGLTTLTVLDWALRYIKRLDPESTLDLETIPVDDAPTFRLFQEGRTDAIFQFESRGMRDLLVQRDKAARELDQQIEGFGEQRKTLAGRLPAELIALYDKIAQRAGGTGAAELRARRCGGCGLELDVSELKRQATAAPDQVLRCEECGRILVRTDNSGL